MLDRKWEKFKGGPEVFRDKKQREPRVTINSKGQIYMNRRAYEAIGSPKAVVLYYNRHEDSIALEPAVPRFAENFPVVKRQLGWGIYAATFCRHYNIYVPSTERFLRPDLDPSGHLILSLRQTVSVGGVHRNKSQ